MLKTGLAGSVLAFLWIATPSTIWAGETAPGGYPATRVTGEGGEAATGEDVPQGGLVGKLCRELEGRSIEVQRAATLALRRTRSPEALQCIKKLSSQLSPSIEATVAQTIRVLDAATTAQARPPRKGDRIYLVVDEAMGQMGRDDESVSDVVRAAFRAKLATLDDVAWSNGDGAPKARVAMKKLRLKGIRLATAVDAPEYGENGLAVTVRITASSYPDGALIGAFSPKLSLLDVKSTDVDSEDVLVELCVDRALDALLKTLSQR